MDSSSTKNKFNTLNSAQSLGNDGAFDDTTNVNNSQESNAFATDLSDDKYRRKDQINVLHFQSNSAEFDQSNSSKTVFNISSAPETENFKSSARLEKYVDRKQSANTYASQEPSSIRSIFKLNEIPAKATAAVQCKNKVHCGKFEIPNIQPDPAENRNEDFNADEPHTLKRLDATMKLTMPNQKSPIILASSSDIKSGHFFTYSPLLNDSYKYGNYFHFPDVDSPTEILHVHKKTPNLSNNNIVKDSPILSSNVNNNYNFKNNNIDQGNKTSAEAKENEKIIALNDNQSSKYDGNLSTEIGLLAILGNEWDETSENTRLFAHDKSDRSESVRRARLKSISLDSDGAKLVEENLYIPVEELVERANPVLFSDCRYQRINDMNKVDNNQSNLFENAKPKLDIHQEDEYFRLDNVASLCHISDSNEYLILNDEQKAQTPKTPTLSQTRQKAVSLDSELLISTNSNLCSRSVPNESCYTLSETDLCHIESESSSSVPTSPKIKSGGSPLPTNCTKSVENKWHKKSCRNSYSKSSNYFNHSDKNSTTNDIKTCDSYG